MKVYKLEDPKEYVTVLSPEKAGSKQGQLQERELPRVLNLEESSEHHK